MFIFNHQIEVYLISQPLLILFTEALSQRMFKQHAYVFSFELTYVIFTFMSLKKDNVYCYIVIKIMYILNGIRQQEQPSLDLPIHVHQGQIEPIKILQCLILITAFRI